MLSRTEVRQFLATMSSLKHRTILSVCYAAGLRISEAVRLQPADIDSQRMVLRVTQGKGQMESHSLIFLLGLGTTQAGPYNPSSNSR